MSAAKFISRYATFGFNDSANLDDGKMWSAAFHGLMRIFPSYIPGLSLADSLAL